MDFSGKSTLVRALVPHLAGADPPTHFTREPGGTPAAERIRKILVEPGMEMDAWTEAYLYAAARADHARGEILPRLEAGETVLCERYLDSSLAYQGFGRGLGVDAVRALNAFAVGAIVPDSTFGGWRRASRSWHNWSPGGSRSSTLRDLHASSPGWWWGGYGPCNILVGEKSSSLGEIPQGAAWTGDRRTREGDVFWGWALASASLSGPRLGSG